MPSPDWSAFILFPLLISLVVLMLWVGDSSERRDREHVRRVFTSRATVSASEFAAVCAESPPMDIVDRVRTIIAKIWDWSREPDAAPSIPPKCIAGHDVLGSDLGYSLDSLAFVELAASIEKEFSVRITDREFVALRTAADVASLVWHKLQTDKTVSPSHSDKPAHGASLFKRLLHW